MSQCNDLLDRLRKAAIAQAKVTAYYNGKDGDDESLNRHEGHNYVWEDYLCDELREALQGERDG